MNRASTLDVCRECVEHLTYPKLGNLKPHSWELFSSLFDCIFVFSGRLRQ
jgi:hypothetical protein